MATTTLTVAAAGCTITGGLTAASTTTSFTGAQSVDCQSGGKYYWECTSTTVGSASDSVGLANINASLTASGSANKITWARGGTVAANGTTIGTAASYTNGSLLCFAVDFSARLWWCRVGAAGNWNNSATANPATGVGGFAFGSIDALAPFVQFDSTGDAVTFNFGAALFTGTVPSGFTSGFSTATTHLIVTQLGIEAWVANVAPMRATQVGLEVWRSTGNANPVSMATTIGSRSKGQIKVPTIGTPIKLATGSQSKPIIKPLTPGILLKARIGSQSKGQIKVPSLGTRLPPLRAGSQSKAILKVPTSGTRMPQVLVSVQGKAVMSLSPGLNVLPILYVVT